MTFWWFWILNAESALAERKNEQLIAGMKQRATKRKGPSEYVGVMMNRQINYIYKLEIDWLLNPRISSIFGTLIFSEKI